MSEIVLMIPQKDDFFEKMEASGSELTSESNRNRFRGGVPWVEGECIIAGYERMILLTEVEWNAQVDDEDALDGRRTLHAPTMDPIKISRRVDVSSPQITQWSLVSKVSRFPWEIYFLRSLGREYSTRAQRNDTPMPIRDNVAATMHDRFMTIKLHNALITSYSFTIGEGDAEETLEVSATRIEWIYHPVGSDQRRMGEIAVRYDIQTGQVW